MRTGKYIFRCQNCYKKKENPNQQVIHKLSERQWSLSCLGNLKCFFCIRSPCVPLVCLYIVRLTCVIVFLSRENELATSLRGCVKAFVGKGKNSPSDAAGLEERAVGRHGLIGASMYFLIGLSWQKRRAKIRAALVNDGPATFGDSVRKCPSSSGSSRDCKFCKR